MTAPRLQEIDIRTCRTINLDRYVLLHGRLPIEITPELRKPVDEHAITFSLAIGTVVKESFPVCCALWEDIMQEAKDLLKARLMVS